MPQYGRKKRIINRVVRSNAMPQGGHNKYHQQNKSYWLYFSSRKVIMQTLCESTDSIRALTSMSIDWFVDVISNEKQYQFICRLYIIKSISMNNIYVNISVEWPYTDHFYITSVVYFIIRHILPVSLLIYLIGINVTC